MKWLFIAIVTGLISPALGAVPTLSIHDKAVGPSDVNVFGSVAVDTGIGLATDGFRTEPVHNCDSDGFYCLAGAMLDISIPRKCSDIRRSHSMDILASFTSKGIPSDTIYVFSNKTKNYVIYLYSEQNGLIALIYDTLRQEDLRTEYLRSKPADFAGIVKLYGRKYQPLVTMRKMMPCS